MTHSCWEEVQLGDSELIIEWIERDCPLFAI